MGEMGGKCWVVGVAIDAFRDACVAHSPLWLKTISDDTSSSSGALNEKRISSFIVRD